MSLQTKVLEKIRKDIWQVGREDEGVKILKNQFQNAMVQLSEKLYSSNGHFIFELLQNADDNSYTKKQLPSISFNLEKKSLTLVNNEDGFQEENVYSICQIGKSTKKSKVGFIGEKGIGFKSCFRITNEPHIISNQFQFKFDKTQELGYVIPILVEDTSNLPLKVEQDKTFIHLPFQKGITYEEIEKLLKDINLETLLFLRRLKVIEIKLQNEIIHYQVDQKSPIDYILKNNDKENYFKVIKKEFDTKYVQDEDRPNVEKVEVILAFKVDQECNPILYDSNLFAFLPVKNVGFKFCIQSDFITISSRENIDKDKKWNRFIRDQISDVIMEAFIYFKDEKNLKFKWWSYLPLKKEVDNFFKSSVDEVYIKLKKEKSILTIEDNYLNPYSIIDYDKDLIDLISNQELSQHLKHEFIHPKLQLSDDLKEILEIKKFTSEMMTQILSKIDIKSKTEKWFTKLYQYIEKNNIQISKNLKFILLESGEISNLEKLYFPYGLLEKQTDIDSEIQKTIKVIKKSTLFEDNILDNLIYKYFEKEGVKQISFQDIIQNEIFMDSSKMEEEKHLYHVYFLRENYHEMTDEMIQYLKENFLFLTKGKEKKIAKEIYLSKEYSKEHEPYLESFLTGTSFISPKYLDYTVKKLKKDQNREFDKWRAFFEELELNGYLKFEYHSFKMSDIECKALYQCNSSCIIEDIKLTDDVKNIINNNPKEVIKMIDFYWKYYQELKDKKIQPLKKYLTSSTRPSSLFEYIQDIKIRSNAGIWEIKELFYGNNSMDFKDWPYYKEEIKNQELRKYLNISDDFNDLQTFFKRIRQLKKDKTLSNTDIYSQNFLILTHLQSIESDLILKDVFTKEELIYIKDKWYLSNQLFWDQDEVFQSSNIPPISSLITSGDKEVFKKFFLGIGILKERSFKDLIQVLDSLSKYILTEETKKNVLKIYFKLDSLIENGNDISWFKNSKENVLLTSKGILDFKSTSYLNDNDDLYSLFKDKVPIVSFPKSDIGKLHNFTRFLSLKSLNSSVKFTMNASKFEVDQKQSNLLKINFQYILKYFINYDYYFYIENKHLFPDQSKIEFRYVSNEIQLNYELEKNYISHRSNVKFDLKNHHLYVQRKVATKNDILNEIAGIYPTVKKNELKSFLFTLFSNSNPEDYFNFLGISEKIEKEEKKEDEDEDLINEHQDSKIVYELFGEPQKYDTIPIKNFGTEEKVSENEYKSNVNILQEVGIKFEPAPYKQPQNETVSTSNFYQQSNHSYQKEFKRNYQDDSIEWTDFSISKLKNPFKNLDKELKTHQNEEDSKEVDLEGMKIVLNYELNRMKKIKKNVELFNLRDPMIQSNSFILDVSTKENIEKALKYVPSFKPIYNEMIKNQIQPSSLGFDILTINPISKQIDRVIEVKSSSIMKSTIELTHLEWNSSQSNLLKSKYYLYFIGNINFIPKGYIFDDISSLKCITIPRYIIDLGSFKSENKKEIQLEEKKELKEESKLSKETKDSKPLKVEESKSSNLIKSYDKTEKKEDYKKNKTEHSKESYERGNTKHPNYGLPATKRKIISKEIETIEDKLTGIIDSYDDDLMEGVIIETSRTGKKQFPFEMSECIGFFPKKGLNVTFNV